MEQKRNAEQQRIFEIMCDEDTNKISTCCVVSAFGGFGKTQLISAIAEERYKRGFGCSLLITFAKKLKETLRTRAKQQEGLVVQNVHSLIRNELNRGQDCVNEADIVRYLQMDPKPPLHSDFYNNVNLVIFDEMQDLTPTFYEVVEIVRKLFAPKVVSFLGMGDFFQAEHAHIGSSTQYMTNAKKYFAHDRFFEFIFRGSFRLDHDRCAWINTNLNPKTIQTHYPACWAKYGADIDRMWGQGLVSYRCKNCNEIHDNDETKNCSQTTSACLKPSIILARNRGRFNKNQKPLPEIADQFVRTHDAIVFLNARKSDAYQKHYANVTTPFQFKGCETNYAVVVGFEFFTEQFCASKAQQDQEDQTDWPFVLFCQMFVSFTRAKKQMIAVIDGRDNSAFFTMRSDSIPLTKMLEFASTKRKAAQRNEHVCNKQAPKKQRIPSEVVIQGLDTKQLEKMMKWLTMDTRYVSNPDSKWIVTEQEQLHFDNLTYSMQQFCKDVVLLAVYDNSKNETPLPCDWTKHLAVQIKRRFATLTQDENPLTASWCQKRAACLQHLLSNVSLNFVEFAVHEPFVFGNICGTIDLFTMFGCLFVCFEPIESRKLLQCITSFLCCKMRARELPRHSDAKSQLFTRCQVVSLCNFAMHELSLNVHEDFFLSQLTCKQVEHLFDQTRFGEMGLLLNQVPILVSSSVFKQK